MPIHVQVSFRMQKDETIKEPPHIILWLTQKRKLRAGGENLQVLKKSKPTRMTAYFSIFSERQEYMQQCFKLIRIVTTKPIYIAWLHSTTKRERKTSHYKHKLKQSTVAKVPLQNVLHWREKTIHKISGKNKLQQWLNKQELEKEK